MKDIYVRNSDIDVLTAIFMHNGVDVEVQLLYIHCVVFGCSCFILF